MNGWTLERQGDGTVLAWRASSSQTYALERGAWSGGFMPPAAVRRAAERLAA